uniref:Plant natriuretic peptide-like 8 n=1 Tax=Venturia inaequalis TaxID=5025 RepID=A0A513ZS84_VENIN|nr:plant natriuretic peptide-like 8 [Venturia inaequalis]
MKVTTALIALSSFAHLGLCEVGVVTSYKPPYLPTKCFGSDQTQFPPGNLFAAAGPALWYNGAACGRHYELRCLNTIHGVGKCLPGSVNVRIVEGRLGNRSPVLSLSQDAAKLIYTGGGTFKAEYKDAIGA